MRHLLHNTLDNSTPVMVSGRGSMRSLHFGLDSCEQSRIDLDCPEQLQLAYTRCLLAPLIFQARPRRVLLLGLGGGSLVHFLLKHLEQGLLDVVEKSAVVIDCARRFFSLPRDQRLQLFRQPAEIFLAQAQVRQTYELIPVDLYGPESMAGPLFDEAFHSHILAALTTEGMASYNLWSSNPPALAAAKEAIGEAFGQQTLKLPVIKEPNLCLLAGAGQLPGRRPEPKRLKRLERRTGLELGRMAQLLMENNREWQRQLQ